MVFLFVTGFFGSLDFKEYENGIWVSPNNMDEVDFRLLREHGINNVYLHADAIDEKGKDYVEKWISKANVYGVKVHIWVPIFVEDGMWVSVEDSNGTVNQEFINQRLDKVSELAQIKGISGIQLDYLRFSGYADSYPNPNKPLNDFAHDAHDRIKAVNPLLELSITIMPETYFILLKNHNDYGQDYAELSSVADKVIIMMYKGNYNQDSDWIKDRTEWFVHNSNGAQVIIGLQTYESEHYAKRLSTTELTTDANAALEGGAQGISFFRYGLTNLINLNNLQ